MATVNEPNNLIEKTMCFAKGRRKKKKRKITGPIYVGFYRDDGKVVEIDWTWRPKIPPRYYGVFICRKFSCGRRWESSWTWLGRRQKCYDCRKYTIPSYVEELRDRSYWIRRERDRGGNGYIPENKVPGYPVYVPIPNDRRGRIPENKVPGYPVYVPIPNDSRVYPVNVPIPWKPPKDQHDIQGCEYCKELLIKLGINCTQLPKDQYGNPDDYLDDGNRFDWDEISLMSDDTSSVCSSIENNLASLTVDDELSQTGFSDTSDDSSEQNI